MNFYHKYISPQLFIIIPLVINVLFLMSDIHLGHTSRIILGLMCVGCLSAAYVFYFKNKMVTTYLVLAGLVFCILSLTLTNGGFANASTTIYMVGFAIFSLWTVGVDNARLVFKATLMLLGLLAIHYLTGSTDVMNLNDDKRVFGLPIRETLAMLASFTALLFIAKDYSKKKPENC